eukprot:531151-Pleurochrysis_carterae.AAC.1
MISTAMMYIAHQLVGDSRLASGHLNAQNCVPSTVQDLSRAWIVSGTPEKRFQSSLCAST